MRVAMLVACVVLAAVGASVLIARGSRPASLSAGAVLLTASLCLVPLARRQLGRAFTWGPKPQARFLVTHGLYSRIPHPMLVFILVGVLGAVIVSGRQWLVLLWIALAIEAAWHARREARVLEAAFGDAYREYRRHTWW